MALADYIYDFEDEDLLLDFAFIDDGGTTSTTATSVVSVLCSVSFAHSNTTSDDDDSLADSHLKSSSSLIDSEDAPLSADAIDEATHPKRKRRRYPNAKDAEGNWLVPRVPLPRILKSDIRRSYGLMFTNVYNSCDYDYMTSYLDQFVSPNFLYRFTKFNVTKSLSGSKKLMGQFWYEWMMETPDVVFHFEAGHIKVRSDGTAVLSGQFILTGTKFIAPTPVANDDEWNGFKAAPHDEPGEAKDSSPTSVSDAATMACHEDSIDEVFQAAAHAIESMERLQWLPDDAPSSSAAAPLSTDSGCDKDLCPIQQYSQATAYLESQCQEACEHWHKIVGDLSMHMDAQYMVEMIDMAVQNISLTPIQLFR